MLDNIEKTPLQKLDLDFVKNYLRVDYDHDDQYILLLMKAADDFIKHYLGLTIEEMETEYGEVPVSITIPFLTIISHWYDRREVQAHRNTEKELKYVFGDVLGMYRNWHL